VTRLVIRQHRSSIGEKIAARRTLEAVFGAQLLVAGASAAIIVALALPLGTAGGIVWQLIIAIVGACLLIAIVRAISGGRHGVA